MTAQTPPCPVQSLVIDPSNTSVLYAIGTGGLFASSDGGAAWRLLYAGVSFSGFPHTLTIDPRDSEHLFLSTDKALVESRDSGRNWTGLAVPQYPAWVILLGLSGVSIDRFAGSLYIVAYTRPITGVGRRLNYLNKSVDGGQTWSALLLGDPGITVPILDRSSAGRLFVGVFGHAEVPTDPPGVSLTGGILMSRDGGLTWSTNPATYSSGPWCTSIVADPVDPNILYSVVACDNYATYDAGTNWVVFSRNCSVGGLVSGPSEVFANGSGGVLIRPKGSLAWQPLLPPGNTLFAVDPSGDVLYVGREGALLKSADGGRTFDTICEAPGRPGLQRSGSRSPARPVAPRN